MGTEMRDMHPRYGLLPTDLAGFDDLAELALDMRWSWNHAADHLWRRLDPELWSATHNPWILLQTVSRDEIQRLLTDPATRKQIADLVQTRREANVKPTWYQQNHPQSSLTCCAYFSMEYMLSESLPIYSGGLGNVAGDQLKTASDLGVPVVGIGLLYQQGYFRQVIDNAGRQQALFPYNDPGQLPVTPARSANGEWLRLEIALPGYSVWIRAWEVQVGRVKLYLLDSNDAANAPAHRGITSELYGGDPELRLRQELLLGIGGWRLLGALGIRPEVCHLNEGHAAFAVLERAREYMLENSQPFDVALAVTRSGNVFTSHTAVAAGFDRFPPDLIEQHLGRYAEKKLGISLQELLALGRENADDPTEYFNMAYLAIRGSGRVNGVSQLHGQVSRKLFQPLFPRWPEDEVPVGYVTNGVHMPTWDSAEADEIWTEACGKDRWRNKTDSLEKDVRKIPDAALWQFRNVSRADLVAYTREHLARQLAASGADTGTLDQAKHLLDPNVLTLCFARRFATYKRPDLLLHDPERLLRILSNSARPVQIIIAGKAHPADLPGQALIQRWVNFIRQPASRPHMVFLSDYDMLLTEHLVRGADVWLNTPRRPWEACGTSGMKVLVNGGINLSELDGWWAEAYTPDVGWALGDGKEHGDDPAWDAAEAEALYDLLEREVIPEFYTRDANDIPTKWVNRMRESMATLTPRFAANRTVIEYAERHYLPAAEAYLERSADGAKIGIQMEQRRNELDRNWMDVHLGDLKVDAGGNSQIFHLVVSLGKLHPAEVDVQLYADGIRGGPPERHEMLSVRPSVVEGAHLYSVSVPTTRQSSDYTVRIVPIDVGASIPLEEQRILWQQR